MRIGGLISGTCFGLLVLLGVSAAQADIIGIKDATGPCGPGPGGTICSAGTTPFSLKGIEDGSIILQAVVGSQTAPVYLVQNDTGGTVTSVSLTFNGVLPSNQFLTCQSNGGFAGDPCIITPNNTTLGNGQPGGAIQDGPSAVVPAIFTWSGLSITNGSTFDIAFASFGNGATGTLTGTPTPEPSTLALLATGLFGLLGFARRKLNA